MKLTFIISLLTCQVMFAGNQITAPALVSNKNDTCRQRADLVASKLLSLRKHAGLWKRAGWWNSANIFEALIDYSRLTGKNVHGLMDKIYNQNKSGINGNYLSNAFDDNAWWALAWIKAYDLTGKEKYISISKKIFEDLVKRAWDNNCAGGVVWAQQKRYKNAVTNELFMLLAARLCLREKDSVKREYYKNWALKDWKWFGASGMINQKGLINDGLNKCENNHGLTWTYNQGVVLGALKDLCAITADSSFVNKARYLAHSSMIALRNNDGMLTEPAGPKGGADKNQFKGVYVRYLAELNTVISDTAISKFLMHNADYMCTHAMDADGLVDFYWAGPYTDWSGSAQGSALDLMNAALMQEDLK
jgi:predicted alpha-1,6-mannanase (GH76 family)